MADTVITDKHSGQESKVIFPDGRELFVQGQEEISADILQKAFDDASGSSDDPMAMNGKLCYDPPEASDFISKDYKNESIPCEPFLAIYEGENGQTRTVKLTTEQAESMGIHFSSDAEIQDISQLAFTDQLHIEHLPDGIAQIYSEVPVNNDQVLFDERDMNETMIFEDSEIIHTSQENVEDHLITSMSGVLNENGNQQLTLSIPQVINGKVTYTVKVSDDLQPPTETFSKFNTPVSGKQDQKYNTLQLAAQTSAQKRTPVTLGTSLFKANSSISKAQLSLTDQCSRTITVKQSLINNKRQKYLIETRPKVLTNIVAPKVLTPSQMKGIPLYDSAVVNIGSELPPRPKASLFLSPKPTPSVPTINTKPREIAAVAKPSAGLAAGKFTHVMASEGQLVSGSATEQGGKQMSSELSAVLTKMMPRQINKTKPLGSSENPIQLVQHGQTFHSVQSLNEEQLKQIATVLQRQHLESPPRATKNVLYNAETNTRIIYRVVYPEDLKDAAMPGKGKRGRPRKIEPGKADLKQLKEDGEEGGEDQKAKRPRGRPRKSEVRPKSPGSVPLEESQPKDEAEDMGEDAQERKRLVARTRSGRVSRPPRHMVKDYKRLNRLDPSEPDVDDSDGGYSDYQFAEQTEAVVEEPKDELLVDREQGQQLLTGLPTVKRNISSSNRCPTCQKIYLGHSRMAHHFEVFPDHRLVGEELEAPRVLVPEKPLLAPPAKKKKKGPWAYMTAEARSDRRKLKLREVLATLEPGELAEVAGPALADVITTWDLLLLRVHAARTRHGHAAAFCAEVAAVVGSARRVAARVLRPANVGREQLGDEMQLDDPLVCSALDLPCGLYHVDDGPLRQHPSPSQRSPPPERGNSSPPCPELLTALTLVAKKPQPNKELHLTGDLVSMPEPHPDLIDDIVNERLENLANDGLCDYVSSPMAVNGRSPEMIDTLDHFQSNESKSVWEKEKGAGETRFDEADLRMDDSGNENNSGEAGYDAEMALDMGSDRVAPGEFDSEMELAGIGDDEREGDSANMSGVSFDPSDSLMEDDEVEFASNVNSSTGSYDRAMSLAEMQESGSSKPSDESPNESRTFPGLGLADVSLDESGPELDFEALSEEFNRNTRHSS